MTRFHPSIRSLLLTSLSAALLLTLPGCANTDIDKSEVKANSEKLDDRLDRVLNRAASKAAYQGKTGDTLALLESVYKRNSTDPKAAINYSQALRHAGRYNRASMIIAPFASDDNAATKAEYAYVKSGLGDYIDAEYIARQAIEIDPEYAKAHHVLGTALSAQDNFEEAENSFRTALEYWVGNTSQVLNNLGLNLAAQGKLQEALEVLNQALDRSPNRVQIERNLRIVNTLYQSQPQIEPINSPEPLVKPER
jgi:Flp pilus assembly protein TadD